MTVVEVGTEKSISETWRWWVYIHVPVARRRRSVGEFRFARGGVEPDRFRAESAVLDAKEEASREYLLWQGFSHVLRSNGSVVPLHVAVPELTA